MNRDASLSGGLGVVVGLVFLGGGVADDAEAFLAEERQ